MKSKVFILISLLSLSACDSGNSDNNSQVVDGPVVDPIVDSIVETELDTGVTITAYSDRLNALINPNAEIQILASGFEWSEGPLWVNDSENGYVLFSDVPENKIYRWSENDGLSTFMSPSGYMGNDGGFLREPGTNGLILSEEGSLIAADHGERGLSLINLQSKTKTGIVTEFEGQSFNSPNDVVMAKDGSLYFTDPPYGLAGINDSPYKELDFNGVFLYDSDGNLSVVDRDLTFPNGIGLSPDGKTLIVANSDPSYPVWKKYSLDENGLPTESSIFYDASAQVEEGLSGLPDGLAIDNQGNVFASGPGGIYIFAADGTLLGLINPGRSAANCTFGGPNGSTLFITADDVLISVETNTRGQ